MIELQSRLYLSRIDNEGRMERNQEASVYVGNLDERVNEGLVWELMLQAGPVGRHLVINHVCE